MPYSRDCSTYWCDKCGGECVTYWKDTGDIYLVLKCTRCDFTRDYVALDDVVGRHCTQCGYGYKPDVGHKEKRADGSYPCERKESN